jgi:hypothetical protein
MNNLYLVIPAISQTFDRLAELLVLPLFPYTKLC